MRLSKTLVLILLFIAIPTVVAEDEPNDSLQNAIRIETDGVYAGLLSSLDDIDYYRLSSTGPDGITVNLTATHDVEVMVYVLYSMTENDTERYLGREIFINLYDDAFSTSYIVIRGVTTPIISYEFMANFTDYVEPTNIDLVTALNLEEDTYNEGFIKPDTPKTYFNFTITEQSIVRVILFSSTYVNPRYIGPDDTSESFYDGFYFVKGGFHRSTIKTLEPGTYSIYFIGSEIPSFVSIYYSTTNLDFHANSALELTDAGIVAGTLDSSTPASVDLSFSSPQNKALFLRLRSQANLEFEFSVSLIDPQTNQTLRTDQFFSSWDITQTNYTAIIETTSTMLVDWALELRTIDFDSFEDTGNSREEAVSITNNTVIADRGIHSTSDEDWYTFSLSVKTDVTFNFHVSEEDPTVNDNLNFLLYNSTNYVLYNYTMYSEYWTLGNTIRLDPGEYYFKLSNPESFVRSYEFDILMEPVPLRTPTTNEPSDDVALNLLPILTVLPLIVLLYKRKNR